MGDDETAADGMVWRRIELGNAPGRLDHHTVLTESSGPMDHSKRLIVNGIYSSIWRVLIDSDIFVNIKSCTEIRAHEEIQDDS